MISGYSHSFDVGVAQQLGVNAAIVLNHIIYWLRINKKKSINQIDGRTWIFETNKEIADFFGYLSEKQVRSAVDSLEQNGLLIKGHYHKNPFNRTNWYAVYDESIIEEKPHSPYRANPCGTQDNSDLAHRANVYINNNNKEDNIKHTQEKPKENVCVFSSFGEHVKLTREAYDQLCKDYGTFLVDETIVEMNDWITSKGKPYKEYASAIRTWIRKNQKKDPVQISKTSVTESKKHIETVEKEYISDYYTIDILSKSVEFKPKTPQGIIHSVKFEENGFKDQVINKLEKLGFKKRRK